MINVGINGLGRIGRAILRLNENLIGFGRIVMFKKFHRRK